MRRMPGRRERLEVEDAVADDPHVRLRNGRELAPEPVEVVSVEPAGASLEAIGVDEMRRPDLAHVDEQARVLSDKRPRRARVVEVDVGEHEVAQLPDLEPMPRKRRPETVQAACRAAVDERQLLALEQVRADDALAAEVLEVEELHPRNANAYSTVSVPSMPASRCPGIAQ